METRTTIWPYDILTDPRPAERNDPNNLRCFLICPFKPSEIYDDLFHLIQDVCNQVGEELACKIDCVRADKIDSSGVIHSEIWHEIQTADIVIADVSGFNGNVMIELGVASACRRKENVVILREDNPAEHFLFDIGPTRHILYKRTYSGFKELYSKLNNAIVIALTSAPFVHSSMKTELKHLISDFSTGKDVEWLVGPSLTHRRVTPEYLEFGSLFVFRNSWLSVDMHSISKFKITAEMKFTQLRGVFGWIGITIRSQHFFANYGHLLYLTSTGDVCRTVPENDLGVYHDEKIGNFDNFNPSSHQFYKFCIEADQNSLSMYINGVGDSFSFSEMPYVYPSGRILFQTYNARVGIKTIDILDKT